MNSLLVTNILLCVITAAIAAVAVALVVLLARIISLSNKINRITSAFESDVMRARNAVASVGKKIVRAVKGTKDKK